jgi:IS5 family transposase
MVKPGKLLKFAAVCLGVVVKEVSEYSSKYSRKDFTQHQLMVLCCLMQKYKRKYREFIEILEVATKLQEFLGIDKIPHFTTLNKFFLRMKGRVFTVLMQMSSGKCSGDTGVDGTCFDRRHCSRHYSNRAKMRIKSIKSTLHVDANTQKILDAHHTTTRKHDSKIILPLVKKTRQRHRIRSTRGDCGYDDKKVRKSLKKMRVRSLIKHREFKPLQKAWNARMSKKEYNKRWINETANSVVKRKYGDDVSSKKWNNQFKELNLRYFVYNIDLELREEFNYF